MIINSEPIYIDPELWGSHYWYVIETMVLSLDTKEIYSTESLRLFLFSLQNLLPCPICRSHFQDYFQNNDFEKYASSKKKILLWIYQLRKEIQIRNNKTYPSFEEYIDKIRQIPIHFESTPSQSTPSQSTPSQSTPPNTTSNFTSI